MNDRFSTMAMATDRRVLFVSNGHGEIALSHRIARELPAEIAGDHLALVGEVANNGHTVLRDVGPRRSMPSGGLVAMGNVRNIARDVRAGLIGLTLAQLRFLRGVQRTYCAAVAVGDVYALLMALYARAQATVFVGTAKSVYVAPYGAFEERTIRRAQAVFVRDVRTAERLRAHGIAAHAANVVVDLYSGGVYEKLAVPFSPRLAIFPGSRPAAYDDARLLCRIVRELASARPQLGAVLSVAPGLEAGRMAASCAQDGWEVRTSDRSASPFSLYVARREVVRGWTGSIAPMLEDTVLVLGQAGTANEAAAAAGIPVVAFERAKTHAWYRKRQIALLGDALLIVSGDAEQAAARVGELLDDATARERMGAAGRERMGPPGAAKLIVDQVVRLCP